MHERCTKFYTDIRSTHLRTQNMENQSSTAPDEPDRSPHASKGGSRPNGNFQQMGTADVCIRWIQLGDWCSKTNSKRCWPWREHGMQWRFLNRKKQMYTQLLQAGCTRTTATVSRFSWPKQSHQFLAIQQLFIVFVWARASFPIRFDQLMILLTRISHLSKPPSSLSTKIHATIAHLVQGSYCLHASPGPTVWMLGWRSSGRGIRFTGQEPVEPGEWRWGCLNGDKYVRANHSFTFLSTRTWEILK